MTLDSKLQPLISLRNMTQSQSSSSSFGNPQIFIIIFYQTYNAPLNALQIIGIILQPLSVLSLHFIHTSALFSYISDDK